MSAEICFIFYLLVGAEAGMVESNLERCLVLKPLCNRKLCYCEAVFNNVVVIFGKTQSFEDSSSYKYIFYYISFPNCGSERQNQ